MSFKYTIAIGLGVAALLPPVSSLAQPPRDVAARPHEHVAAVSGGHSSEPTPHSITFTNPLGRSRGPGAGAGLL